ncbi:MAG: hypothetical protein IAE83_08245 [Anaerolinea sp.]|nr:hypothetical protein [Anaerolinea sp.]
MDFNPEQLKLIAEAPIQIMKGMMTSDLGGVIRMIRETAAAFDYVTNAQARFKDNKLVQQAVARFIEFTQKGADDPTSSDPQAPMSQDDFQAYYTKVAFVIGDSPDATDFKKFLYGLAEAVAGAAGKGLLGRGSGVSTEEQGFLDKLKALFKL